MVARFGNFVKHQYSHLQRNMTLRNDRLRKIREEQGLSQRELGKLCGFGEETIFRYETNKSDPGAKHLKTIADKLNVSTDYLLGLTDAPHGLAPGTDLNDSEHEILDVFRRDGWRGLLRLVTEHLGK